MKRLLLRLLQLKSSKMKLLKNLSQKPKMRLKREAQKMATPREEEEAVAEELVDSRGREALPEAEVNVETIEVIEVNIEETEVTEAVEAEAETGEAETARITKASCLSKKLEMRPTEVEAEGAEEPTEAAREVREAPGEVEKVESKEDLEEVQDQQEETDLQEEEEIDLRKEISQVWPLL